MARDIRPTETGLNIGRLVVFALALSLAGIILYKYYGNRIRGYTSIPKELQLNYLPADYSVTIDPDDALAILSNPERYRKEFNQMVYDMNMSILQHVANRMGISDSLKSLIRVEYEKHHPYLRNLYFHDFMQLKDTTSNLYQTWYNNEGGTSVDALNQVASKYTCFLVTQVITTLVKTLNGSIYAKGNMVDTPCGIATTEALRPIMKKLEERAAIQDFSRSRGLLQEKVERVIAELATMEVRDKKGINKQLQTKIWGFSVSSSDIEITAISILKVGFRLNDYFDVNLDARNGVVTVTLPEPVILSHEVYPKIEKLDIGWLREVKDVNLNRGINSLREEFRREALESDIMEKSKTQAVELMNTMFTPMISSMSNRYKLRVAFKETARERDPEFSPEASNVN
jgi:hypothetical protein